MSNVDEIEIEKFSQLASKWWDMDGEFKPLHEINPLRLAFIHEYTVISGKRILDVGCGGGILSESMAVCGASVTGIDVAKKSLKVARLHSLESTVLVDYRCMAVEDLAEEVPASFDVVTCMEMLEHVPDPQSVVRSCARLVNPGGWVFFSTLNRNTKSYLLAVVCAEYVLNMLPRGTHKYARFIKPSELSRMARNAGLELNALRGISYYPITRFYSLSDDASVNYLLAFRRPD